MSASSSHCIPCKLYALSIRAQLYARAYQKSLVVHREWHWSRTNNAPAGTQAVKFWSSGVVCCLIALSTALPFVKIGRPLTAPSNFMCCRALKGRPDDKQCHFSLGRPNHKQKKMKFAASTRDLQTNFFLGGRRDLITNPKKNSMHCQRATSAQIFFNVVGATTPQTKKKKSAMSTRDLCTKFY